MTCSNDPYQHRNYRNDGTKYPNGIKCSPIAQTIKGAVRDGEVINADGTTSDGSDAPLASQIAGAPVGCGACS